jgi:hypothetical protein
MYFVYININHLIYSLYLTINYLGTLHPISFFKISNLAYYVGFPIKIFLYDFFFIGDRP